MFEPLIRRQGERSSGRAANVEDFLDVQSLESGRRAFGVSVYRQLSCKLVREARMKAVETHATSEPVKASTPYERKNYQE